MIFTFKRIIRCFLFILINLFVLQSYSAAFSFDYTKIRGRVVDAKTKEPLPYVNVIVRGTSIGAITDDSGSFFIETRKPIDSLYVSYLGYKPVSIKIKRNSFQELYIELKPNVTELQTVVIVPGENPANRLLKKITKNKDRNNYKNFPSFSCEIYNKIQIDLNNIDDEFKKKRIFKQFQFVFDNLDTNAVTGKVYLPILISETVSDYYYQDKPHQEKEIIKATQVSGIKNQSVSQFTGQMTQSFNIYDNFMSFYEPGFISPIADFGLLYYRYYITDSAVLDGKWCYHVSFKPIRRQERTFTGDFWVADSVFAVKKIQMRLNKNANINFINELVASYEYQSYHDSIWFLVSEEILADFNITDSKTIKGFFGHKGTTYRNYVFNQPIADEVKELKADIIVNDTAMNQSKQYWDKNRPIQLSEKEEKVYSMVDSIKNVPLYQTFADAVNLVVNYYYPVGKYLEFGPYFSTYSFNEIEGHRFRIGGQTSNQFSTKVMFTGHVAYGTKDEDFKFGLGTRYMFNKSPRRSAGISYKNDIEQLGQGINAFRADNILSSLLRRNPNNKLTMVKGFSSFYEYEWYQGFSNTIQFNNRQIFGTDVIPLGAINGNDTTRFSKVITSEITLQTHFAYKEKFLMGEFERVSVGTEYPVIDLFLTYGMKNVFQSQYEFYKVNLRVTHYFNTNPFGYFKYTLDAGRIFGKLPYPLLELHKGNETYAYDNYAFNMMNYYEFVSDKYATIFAEQHFQGFFLNNFPVIRRLKWREVATFRGLIGTIDEKNGKKNWVYSDGLGEVNKPYGEASIGIENIFKLIRIDAVWRLSYLDHQNIQAFGLRAKLQIVF
jgi:hypothetical protein